MKRVLMLGPLAAAVVAAASVGVSSGRAAPISGGTHVSGTWTAPDYLTVGAMVNGTFSNGLTSLGCPFVLHDYGDNAIGTLTATYNGWLGPINQVANTQQVLLRTRVTGTVQDVTGNSYTVNGKFTDSSIHDDPGGDFRFEGVGRVSLSGPAGRVVGTADFRFVTGPPEYTLTFSSIRSCTI